MKMKNMKKLLLIIGFALLCVTAFSQRWDYYYNTTYKDSVEGSDPVLFLIQDGDSTHAMNFYSLDSIVKQRILEDSLGFIGGHYIENLLIDENITVSGTANIDTLEVTNSLNLSNYNIGFAVDTIQIDGVYLVGKTDTLEVTGDLNVTGNISGASDITLDTDATVVLTSADCKNKVRINNDAGVIDYTLPAAEAGLVVMFYDIGVGVITIDPFDGTDTIYLNGASVGAGDEIDSPGAAGDFIALMAIDDTRWITLGISGTWVDANP